MEKKGGGGVPTKSKIKSVSGKCFNVYENSYIFFFLILHEHGL